MEMVSFGAFAFILMAVLSVALPVLLVWLFVKVVQGLAWGLGGLLGLVGGIIGRVFGFVRGELMDSLHLVGALVTAAVILPLTIANVLILRGRQARHYGRALEDELTSVGLSLYRIALGHPIRLLGLTVLTDGLERRLPELVSRAPGMERTPKPREKKFDGYNVVGTLAAGGSGARLFLARPSDEKRRALLARGHHDPGQVVIKSFALHDGSTLPQIVRESRALEAANKLGLVLEHELTNATFHYVMPFVPGDDLDVVMRRLHARSGPEGLDRAGMLKVVGFATDLMATLDRFHRGGLWHKDIKPSNLIVSGDRVHLVDLGLVTPLASAMTLTTHGTEYFRDPELVRLAMKGVKVHEVDGVKFDVYSAGAVLYSMVENSFPAHGSLSRISKSCPPALQWIIRRAMADLSTRYGSAAEMGRDLACLLAASDPAKVRPADLPSVAGGFDEERPPTPPRSMREAALPSYASGRAGDSGSIAGAGPATAAAAAAGLNRRSRVPHTDRKVRRRTRRGVLAALGVTGMTTLMLGGALTLAHERNAQAHVRRADQDQLAQTRAQTRAERASERRRTQRTASTAALVPKTLAREDTILLLRDLRLSNAASSEALEGVREALEEAGLRVVSADSSNGACEQNAMDWTARAHTTIGLAEPSDAGTARRLEQWIQETEGLDGILWVAPGDGSDRLEYRAIAPPRAR